MLTAETRTEIGVQKVGLDKVIAGLTKMYSDDTLPMAMRTLLRDSIKKAQEVGQALIKVDHVLDMLGKNCYVMDSSSKKVRKIRFDELLNMVDSESLTSL